MKKEQGSITVFLSLISVLFLSLACTLVESVRVQACRAKAEMITRMGLFSVFGEYEKQALLDYDILFLDGACAGKEFSISMLEKKIQSYISQNTKGQTTLLPLKIKKCEIQGYTLATDEKGKVFERQAVEYQKETFAIDTLNQVLEDSREAVRQEEAGESLEEGSASLERQIQQMTQEKEDAGHHTQGEKEIPAKQESEKNPLDVIRQIKKMGILSLVVREPERLSSKQTREKELVSDRNLRAGSLRDRRETGGATEKLLFNQYLKNHFSCYGQIREGGILDYELEYLVAGKRSDVDNLKSVVHRLLLMREGVNFLCVASDAQMRQQALLLATALCGAAPIPALRTAVCAALLLAWAYGESLLEVRTLLAGGKVPMIKTASQWKLSLDQLGNLTQILKECDEGGGEGHSYEEYMWMLLAVGDRDVYAMRAIDLLECRMQEVQACQNFQADDAIVRLELSTLWEIRPMFLRIAAAFLGTGRQNLTVEVRGTFGY